MSDKASIWVVERDVGYGLDVYLCIATNREEAMEKIFAHEPFLEKIEKHLYIYSVDSTDVLHLSYIE